MSLDKISQTPLPDAWDVAKWLSFISAGVAIWGLLLEDDPKAKKTLGTIGTVATVAGMVVTASTPPQCPICGARGTRHSDGSYSCPQGHGAIR